MYNRRKFLGQATLAAGTLLLNPGFGYAANFFDHTLRLTILHTNDTHSRLDPFPMDGSRNQGMGGVAARAKLIEAIRAKEENVLLFDAGDIFQGTAYFNIYRGEPEIKAMSYMNYDATTIGNHDFDAGLENLNQQLKAHSNFPMIVCNYDFNNTPMEYNYAPYKIFKKGSLKIGVFGLGIEMQGRVPANLYGNTKYLDPVQMANRFAKELKDKSCDLVVCLSHLGYKYNMAQVSDLVLAKETENIDLIIGGHTHTFLPAPVAVKNKKGIDVLINQVGWAGLQLGRLDFIFEKNNRKKLIQSNAISITKKYAI
jgi:5'-nucleotidase